MKKILAIILLLCYLGNVHAQDFGSGTFRDIHNGQIIDGLGARDYFEIPHGPTLPTGSGSTLRNGPSLFYNETDSKLYYWNETTWVDFATGTAVTPGLQAVITQDPALTAPNVIDCGTNMQTFTGANTSGPVMKIINTGATGDVLLVQATTTGQIPLTSFGFQGYAIKSKTSTNSSGAVTPNFLLHHEHLTSNAGNGFGASFDFELQTTVGTFRMANKLISKWTTAADGSRTSQYIIQGVNNTTLADLFTLGGNGATKLNKYGVGSFTGTAAYTLQVDASGNIIEGTPVDGSGFVHLTGNETIAGSKTFTSGIHSGGTFYNTNAILMPNDVNFGYFFNTLGSYQWSGDNTWTATFKKNNLTGNNFYHLPDVVGYSISNHATLVTKVNGVEAGTDGNVTISAGGSDNLDDVCARGSTTTHDVTVNKLITDNIQDRTGGGLTVTTPQLTTSAAANIGTDLSVNGVIVANDIQFTGELRPNGNAGTSGYYMTSAGPGTAPLWIDLASQFNNGNGTTYNGGLGFDLGGPLTHNTNVETNGFNFAIGDDGREGIFANVGTNETTIGDFASTGNSNIIRVDDGNNKAYYNNGVHNGRFGVNTDVPDAAFTVTEDGTGRPITWYNYNTNNTTTFLKLNETSVNQVIQYKQEAPTTDLDITYRGDRSGTVAYLDDITTAVTAAIPQNNILVDNTLIQSSNVSTTATSYTTPNDGINHAYSVGAWVRVISATATTIQVNVTFTDEGNTSRTLNFYNLSATPSLTLASGVSTYPFVNIMAKANTTITVNSVRTGTTISYDLSSSLIRLQ